MSLKGQNTKYLLMSLAALAAAGVAYYLLQQQESKAKSLDDDDDMADAETVRAKGRSTTTATKSIPMSQTSKDSSSGKLDEKELHATIEELDKKGKAFFKNKQVGRTRWTSFLIKRSQRQNVLNMLTCYFCLGVCPYHFFLFRGKMDSFWKRPRHLRRP